jgi:signal transduction histidine kinase
MTVVLAWAESLEDHVSEDGEEALQHVRRRSEHVVELTDIAREFVESLPGDGTAELKPIDLRDTLDDELTAVRESHSDARFELPEEIPRVTVRANEMLSSVFRNVLENAVRHNDADTPTVSVSVSDRADAVRVHVSDNGPGIPDEQKEQIFGKGEKGIDSPGTGIGLYLVHTLTDQYGGDVWVEDNEPRGSVFVVELPKADPVPA